MTLGDGPLRRLRERRPRTFAVVYVTLAVFVFGFLAPFAVAYDLIECIVVNAWRPLVNQVRYEWGMCSLYFSFSARLTRDAWNRRPLPESAVAVTAEDEAGTTDESRSGN